VTEEERKLLFILAAQCLGVLDSTLDQIKADTQRRGGVPPIGAPEPKEIEALIEEIEDLVKHIQGP
jgi:hypothetical protein